jgi:hypothetical protein
MHNLSQLLCHKSTKYTVFRCFSEVISVILKYKFVHVHNYLQPREGYEANQRSFNLGTTWMRMPPLRLMLRSVNGGKTR